MHQDVPLRILLMAPTVTYADSSAREPPLNLRLFFLSFIQRPTVSGCNLKCPAVSACVCPSSTYDTTNFLKSKLYAFIMSCYTIYHPSFIGEMVYILVAAPIILLLFVGALLLLIVRTPAKPFAKKSHVVSFYQVEDSKPFQNNVLL